VFLKAGEMEKEVGAQGTWQVEQDCVAEERVANPGPL